MARPHEQLDAAPPSGLKTLAAAILDWRLKDEAGRTYDGYRV